MYVRWGQEVILGKSIRRASATATILMGLLLLIPQSHLHAEVSCLECLNPDDDPATCFPKPIELPLYCDSQPDETLTLTFGLDPNTFDLQFKAIFDGKAPGKKFSFFAVDGPTAVGSPNEVKLTNLKCSDTLTGGQECSGNLTLEKEAKLSSRFDFDQSVINFVLRKGSKDVCIGKLTNDCNILASNSSVQRILCNFIPFENKKTADLNLSGEGYFDPFGYGNEGDGLFHVELEGFPTSQELKGCVEIGTNRFQSAFSIQARGADETDASIYGELSDEASAKLTGDPLAFSYDLANLLRSIESSLSVQTDRSLSQTNLQISAPAASREREESNSVRSSKKKSSAKSKKKKKRGNSGRKKRAGSLIAAAKKSKADKDSFFAWLSFDPRSGSRVLIADSCAGKKVESKSYGSLTCDPELKPAGDDRQCVDLSASSGSAKGRACLDPRTSFSLFLLRVEDLSEGTYTVCLDGQATGASLTVASSSSGTFGSVNLSDNSTVVSSAPGFSLFSAGTLSEVKSIAVSSDSACQEVLLSGSFS